MGAPCQAPEERRAHLARPGGVPGSRIGVTLDLGGSAEPQPVCECHRVSRPTLIFDDVESLSSETKRPLRVGNKIRGAVRRALGCPGLRRSTLP